MLSRRWLARGLDVLAALIVLGALFAFVVVPRLAENAAVPAPPVSLATLGGGRFSIDAQRGRLTYLDFWATWCEPCRQSIPLIQRFARLHPEVDVVSVDVGEPAALVAGFVRTHPMERVALDPDQIAGRAFGVANYPTMVVIDPQGTQRAKWLGFNPQIESQMASVEARLLPNRPSRPPALVLEDEPNSLEHDPQHPVRLAAGTADPRLPLPCRRPRRTRARRSRRAPDAGQRRHLARRSAHHLSDPHRPLERRRAV